MTGAIGCLRGTQWQVAMTTSVGEHLFSQPAWCAEALSEDFDREGFVLS